MGDAIRSSRLVRLAGQGTILALAALLLFVDLFLPWSQSCVAPVVGPAIRRGFFGGLPTPLVNLCYSGGNGWVGFGAAAGLLAGLLLIWEATRVARVDIGFSVGYRSLITAVLSLGVLLCTAIDAVALLTWMSDRAGNLIRGVPQLYGGTFLWIALALAIVIGAGGLVHWGIWQAHAPSASAPSRGPDPAPRPPTPPKPAPPKECSGCGRVNGGAARFCSGCGRSLNPAPPAGPTPEPVPLPPSAPAPPPVCPDCGRVNPDDARFCSGCGKSLSANPGRRSPRGSPPASQPSA
ncbi:MAG: zinc ribbon domain-containing protein [Candidatus Dormibacteria bacterium]